MQFRHDRVQTFWKRCEDIGVYRARISLSSIRQYNLSVNIYDTNVMRIVQTLFFGIMIAVM